MAIRVQEYEPYVLMLRKNVPWYDESYRGYGQEKLSMFAYLAALGVTFRIHPAAFLVHIPHEETAWYHCTLNSPQWNEVSCGAMFVP